MEHGSGTALVILHLIRPIRYQKVAVRRAWHSAWGRRCLRATRRGQDDRPSRFLPSTDKVRVSPGLLKLECKSYGVSSVLVSPVCCSPSYGPISLPLESGSPLSPPTSAFCLEVYVYIDSTPLDPLLSERDGFNLLSPFRLPISSCDLSSAAFPFFLFPSSLLYGSHFLV